MLELPTDAMMEGKTLRDRFAYVVWKQLTAIVPWSKERDLTAYRVADDLIAEMNSAGAPR
jgi:hypothetical protein